VEVETRLTLRGRRRDVPRPDGRRGSSAALHRRKFLFVGDGVAAFGGNYWDREGFRARGCLELDLEDVQPEAARSTHPRVVLADNEDVVVLWDQRAVGHDGLRLDTPVLGLCHVRDGRLARAQMFYFDTADVVQFLAAGNLALDRENPIPKLTAIRDRQCLRRLPGRNLVARRRRPGRGSAAASQRPGVRSR
jgi:ketosteroid isomerase-like protein